jgi:glucosyl-dolichyl phosphate glucuronosyltransferase
MLKVITFSCTGGRVEEGEEAATGFADSREPPHAADARIIQKEKTFRRIRCELFRSITNVNAEQTADRLHFGNVHTMPSTPLKTTATVLICTYNRADLLAETLDSLALSRTTFRWNVIIVDNNSTDQTGSAVTSRAASYPVKLIYLFEPRQGKSNALNTGLAATDAEIIIFTDDDVRVGEGWVEASCRAMLDDPAIDYTGGPVLPIWEQPRPPWLHEHRSDLWGTLAILDYGPQVFIFEDRQRVPLGANMAVRRRLIDRIGGFDPKLGRTGKSLLGQEQAEFFCRSRAIGARGLYVPAMSLLHHVPARRLTREYFRQWWYWKGVSRSRLDQRHTVTELGVNLATVPRIGGVPRFLFGSAVRDAMAWLRALVTLDRVERMRREMMLYYFVGYVNGTWTDRRRSAESVALRPASP